MGEKKTGEQNTHVGRRTLLAGCAAAGVSLVVAEALAGRPAPAAAAPPSPPSPPVPGGQPNPSDAVLASARPTLVGISHGNRDYAAATRAALASAGGLAGVIEAGDSVVIKPNICTEQAGAGSPQITDYRAVQAVIDLARQAGAGRITVMEGSITGNPFSSAALAMNKYKTLTGVDEYIESGSITEDSKLAGIMPSGSVNKEKYYVPKAYLDADKVITVAKLKTHFNAGATLSLKNSIGLAARAKHSGGMPMRFGLHGSRGVKLSGSIVDLNLIRMPDFAVVEGIVGGEGDGPLSCTAVDSKAMFAGQDLVALDTVCITFMGLTVADVPHVTLASSIGLGASDLSRIEVKGATLQNIAMHFRRATIVNP
ncbi:MAG: DUF362 domain-containing protein [Micromonosporaceae bacterium]|nr:DUF362 domain-containing protein [Micromonosporaceae bacterium]